MEHKYIEKRMKYLESINGIRIDILHSPFSGEGREFGSRVRYIIDDQTNPTFGLGRI